MAKTASAPPTLEDLARDKFGVLREVELQLVRRAPDGAITECSPNQSDPSALDNNPSHAETWGKQREMRAALIRWLCIDAEAGNRIDPKGIQIHAARIVDELDLSFVSVRFPLRFYHCSFAGSMDLTKANFPALSFGGCLTRNIAADGVRVVHDLFRGDGFSAVGSVCLRGATIRGDLDCDKGSFRNLPGSGCPRRRQHGSEGKCLP